MIQIDVDSFFELKKNLWRVYFYYEDYFYSLDDEDISFSIQWFSESDATEIEDEVMAFINDVRKDMTINDKKDLDKLMIEVGKRSDERNAQVGKECKYKLKDGEKSFSTPEIEMFKAHKFGWYDDYELSESQFKQLRTHDFSIELKDNRFRGSVTFNCSIITKLGQTGEDLIKGYIADVISENGQFDGFVGNTFNDKDFSKNLTERNKKMFEQIHNKVHKHNLELLGLE